MSAKWGNRGDVYEGTELPMGAELVTGLDAGTRGPATVLPWPSIGWQQLALIGGVALGGIVAAAGFASMSGSDGLMGGLVAGLIGVGLAAMALYAGWTTGWLNKTEGAPAPGVVTAFLTVGLVVAIALVVYLLAVTIYYLSMISLAFFGWSN